MAFAFSGGITTPDFFGTGGSSERGLLAGATCATFAGDSF
jgi:hypothetical protein